MSQNKTVNISTVTFLKIIVIILAILFLYMLKSVFALMFLALILSSAFDPWSDWLRKRGLPKMLSASIVYLVFISVIMGIVLLIVPQVAKEIVQLAYGFPEYYSKIEGLLSKLTVTGSSNLLSNMQSGLNTMSSTLNKTVLSIFSKTFEVFDGVFSFITIIIIAFYFTTEDDAVRKFTSAIIT